MNIGIDGNEANIENKVGVNEYAFRILWELSKLQEKAEFNHRLIVYLKENPRDDMPKESKNLKYIVLSGGGMWILTKLTPRLFFNKEKIDVFFSPSHYVSPFISIPRVCSIMDLGYLEFSGQFTKKVFWQLKWWSAISIIVSKAIIAISNSTKKDIVRHYPSAKNKIYVTHLAYDRDMFNTNISESVVRRIKNRYTIVGNYVLYLGTLKPSKNIEGLMDAFSIVLKKSPDTTMVIAGKKGWMYETIFNKAESLGITKNIKFTGFLPEEDKPGLIAGAKVFVLPSFWEGFGLDVLNAMAAGVPVVASGVGSLPEVVGDAGILVDPKNKDDIAFGITRVLSMSETDYNGLSQKGLAQVKKFSWEKCGRETLKVLENVAR